VINRERRKSEKKWSETDCKKWVEGKKKKKMAEARRLKCGGYEKTERSAKGKRVRGGVQKRIEIFAGSTTLKTRRLPVH